MQKLTIVLDDATWEQVSQFAKPHHISVNQYIEELVDAHCEPYTEDDLLTSLEQAQSEISAIRAEVAELRSLITLQSREAGNQEAAEAATGSQEDEARSHATEEEFVPSGLYEKVDSGLIRKGDLVLFRDQSVQMAKGYIGLKAEDIKSGVTIYRRKP
jgi:hypothetical protein